MAYRPDREIVTEEGYRLAPYLLRVSAALVDLAFLVAGAVLLFFLMTTSAFPTLIDWTGSREASEELFDYQVASGLVVREENGQLLDLSSDDFEDYRAALDYYYLVFQGGQDPANPEPRCYTVKDVNEMVLGLPTSDGYRNHSVYFDFSRDEEGVALLDEPGVIREQFLDENGEVSPDYRSALLSYFRDRYAEAQDHLMAEPFYVAAQAKMNVGYLLAESIALYIPFLVFYVIIPMVNAPSATLGKRWMHLALADSKSGIALEKWRFALRAIPFILAALIVIILNEVILSISAAILLFLISMGLSVFTKKRRALHDYLSNSVVIREEDLLVKKEEEHA